MGLMSDFIGWNKKMFASKEPVIAFAYTDDGHGNKNFGFEIMGSKVVATERQISPEDLATRNVIELVKEQERKRLT